MEQTIDHRLDNLSCQQNYNHTQPHQQGWAGGPMNNTAMPTQSGAVTEYNNSIFLNPKEKLELQHNLASQAQVQTQALNTLS